MQDEIYFTCVNHIGLVTLNRPQALNALTLPMILALREQLQTWNEDGSIHAIVICSAGGKAFCAGGDVRWLYEAGRNHDPQQLSFFEHEYQLNQFIHQLSKPYIALMDGVTMGGGVGVSLHGSHPVASERFVFAMPETGIGFFPDIGASYLLSRCPDHFGTYLGLTGNRISAADAHHLGLVKHLISSEHFPEVMAHLIEADLSQQAHQRVDVCLQRFAMPMVVDMAVSQQLLVNSCFNHNKMESILAALHESDDEWYVHTRQILALKSPLSLKITLSQLLKAKFMTLEECLKMDFCLVEHFMRDHDFYEGVRALLVDKDKSPHWQPAGLEMVTDAKVNSYFF